MIVLTARREAVGMAGVPLFGFAGRPGAFEGCRLEIAGRYGLGVVPPNLQSPETHGGGRQAAQVQHILCHHSMNIRQILKWMYFQFRSRNIGCDYNYKIRLPTVSSRPDGII